MDPLPYMTTIVCWLKGLQIIGETHIPAQGPALLACAHDSPLDFFYFIALMRLAGRQDYRFVAAAELVDAERFRPYTRDAIASSVPWAAGLAGAAARLGSWVVPPLLRGCHPIAIYRQGDDSAARTESVSHLLSGGVVAMAPGWGDNRHRGADGQRPLTHGVAAIARRFFEVTREALVVVPVGLGKHRDGWRLRSHVRLGAPLRAMSEREYPALFSATGQENPAIKHQAYQTFTQELAGRLSELSA